LIKDLALAVQQTTMEDTERSGGSSMVERRSSGSDEKVPDPEVVARPKRRRFTAEYKLRILKEADTCREPGEIGALLRREGLYSSHLVLWRRQRDHGAHTQLKSRKRGPKPKAQDPRVKQLERENARLQRRLKRVALLLDIQKKVGALLGIPLKNLDDVEND
jgi:transposase